MRARRHPAAVAPGAVAEAMPALDGTPPHPDVHRVRISAAVPDHIRAALETGSRRASPVVVAVRIVVVTVLALVLAFGIAVVAGIDPSPVTLLGL